MISRRPLSVFFDPRFPPCREALEICEFIFPLAFLAHKHFRHGGSQRGFRQLKLTKTTLQTKLHIYIYHRQAD
jgi:hypothetical protein